MAGGSEREVAYLPNSAVTVCARLLLGREQGQVCKAKQARLAGDQPGATWVRPGCAIRGGRGPGRRPEHSGEASRFLPHWKCLLAPGTAGFLPSGEFRDEKHLLSHLSD